MKIFVLFMIFQISTYSKMIRLKELITIKGVRENPIVGHGLVVGLNGTGDGGGEITNTSLKRMFQKLGFNLKEEIASKNVAAVIVTTKLPPFARQGQKLDVKISSIAEASSLAGGILLVTPLKGGDGNVYAIASGALSIGGLEKGAKFATTGTIAEGATIEREIKINFDKKKSLRFSLHNPDFTTAARIEKIINKELGGKYSTARDATTLDVIIPVQYQRKVVQLMAIIENFKVHTDRKAKIVINERTGTIVVGGDITIDPVAIGHGDLSIEIKGDEQGGNKSFHLLKGNTTLNDLVISLNAIGATPEDLISIFQTLKKNGALVGEIELL